eukprot:2611286-Alexandrium_andersonii.AAC.1
MAKPPGQPSAGRSPRNRVQVVVPAVPVAPVSDSEGRLGPHALRKCSVSSGPVWELSRRPA